MGWRFDVRAHHGCKRREQRPHRPVQTHRRVLWPAPYSAQLFINRDRGETKPRGVRHSGDEPRSAAFAERLPYGYPTPNGARTGRKIEDLATVRHLRGKLTMSGVPSVRNDPVQQYDVQVASAPPETSASSGGPEGGSLNSDQTMRASTNPLRSASAVGDGGATSFEHPVDLVRELVTRQPKPGPFLEQYAAESEAHPEAFAAPLTEGEQMYLQYFASDGVPEAIRLNTIADPDNLTDAQKQQAHAQFGEGPEALTKFANAENRRLIATHYTMTHPATVRLQLGLYRLVRDANPLHFALERGWQVGGGKEMFTQEDKSRLGAAAEFFAAIGLMYGAGKALQAARPRTGATGPRPVKGVQEYEVVDPAKAAATRAKLEAHWRANAKEPVIEYVEGLEGAQIDTTTGRIRVSKEVAERFPHLEEGYIMEELQHFQQLTERGWLGRELTQAEVVELEAEVVGRILESGFATFRPR